MSRSEISNGPTGRAPFAAGIAVLIALGACRAPTSVAPRPDVRAGMPIVPAPVVADVSPTDSFSVTPRTTVYVDASSPADVLAIADYAANMISTLIGTPAQRISAGGSAPDSNIVVTIDASRTDLGDEGYELNATRTAVKIVAAQPAGLFHGVQTLRQLLPPGIEHQGW